MRYAALVLLALSQLVGVGFLVFICAEYDLDRTILIFAVLLAIGCIVADNYLTKAMVSSNEKEMLADSTRLLKDQLALQEERMRYLKDQQARAMQVRIQIAQQLREAARKLDMGNREEVMKSMEQSVSLMDTSSQICSNPVVDALVSSKLLVCKEKLIPITVQIVLPRDMEMPSHVLCAVFGNALDNAINACTKLNAKDRFIKVESQLRSGMLVLKVANSCNKDQAAKVNELYANRNSGMRTVKLTEHGWGLLILNSLAERFDGSMDVEAKDGVCTITVVMKDEEDPLAR